MDNLAIFKNMDSLEESHVQLTQLIERLDRDSHIDAHEMGNLVTGMGGLLGQFSVSHHELQNEMKDLLESSKNGLLTHEKLVEMVTNEQIRSKFMNKLIGSLKIQIENLFNTFVNQDDSEEGEEIMMEKVANNVNLMWKSVNSLSTLMESPSKKLDHMIRKIDSEVIVHLQQNNSNDRIFADSDREQFSEKIDNQLRTAKERRKNSQSPHRLAQALSSDNLDLSQIDSMGSKPTTFHSNSSSGYNGNNGNNGNGSRGGNNSDSNGGGYGAANNKGNANPGQSLKSVPSSGNVKLKSVSTEKQSSGLGGSSADHRQDSSRQPTAEGDMSGSAEVHSSRQPGGADYYGSDGSNAYGARGGGGGAAPYGQADYGGDYNSARNNNNNNNNDDDSVSAASSVAKSSKEQHGSDHHGSQKGKSSGSSSKHKGDHGSTGSSKTGSAAHKASSASKNSDTHPIDENEVFHDPASSTKGSAGNGYLENSSIKKGYDVGKSAASVSTAGKAGASEKGAHSVNSRMGTLKVIDDESSIESGYPYTAGGGNSVNSNIPPDITELMRIMKEREAVLIKRETDMEAEVKLRVKEYIRSHGIGYQKKTLSTTLLESKAGEGSDGVIVLDGHEGIHEHGPDGEAHIRHHEPAGPHTLRDGLLQRSPSFQHVNSGGSRSHSREGGSGDGDNHNSSPTRTGHGSKKLDQSQQEQHKFNELHDLKQRHGHTGNTTGSRPNSRNGSSRQGPWRTIDPLHRAIESDEVKARMDLDRSYPHLSTLHEIIDIIVNNINHKFNGDLKTIDLIKIVTPKIPIKQDMATDTFDLDAKKPWELPVFHNHANMLITRTYKVTPELQSFLDKLATDANPLKLMYDEFADFLPVVQRERLSFAAMSYPERKQRDHGAQRLPSSTSPSASDWFKLHTNLYSTMNDLMHACMNMLPMITAIETIANEVIQFIKSLKKTGVVNIVDIRNLMQHNSHNIQLLQVSLIDLYRLFGDLQAQEISNHLRLYEFRAFFERINVMGQFELKNLFVEFPDFQKCHQAFNAAQGQVFEVHRRLIECRDRCNKHEIFSLMLISQQQLSQQLSESMTGGSHIVDEIASINFPPLVTPSKEQPPLISTLTPLHIPAVASSGAYGSSSGPISVGPSSTGNPSPTRPVTHHALTSSHSHSHSHSHTTHAAVDHSHMLGELQAELHACHEEIEDLEMELLHVMKERDKTPGAILFFTLMHDQAFIPNLQQLTLQFQQVKGFLDYSVEMDYVTLRKRLQVCLTLMPTIDKLVDKYGMLHKQWTHHRLNFFAERKLRGNAADNLGCCPLCYNELDRIDNDKPITKINKAIVNAEEKLLSKQVKKDRNSRLPSSHQARQRLSATLSMLPSGQIAVDHHRK